MPTVFLSYSREDLLLVEQLETQLKTHSEISIWRDQENIRGGQKWPKMLGEAIADHDVVLLAWSKHAATSHFVEFEWCTAIALKKTIVPCLLDETPLAESLRAYHAHPMSNITGILRTLCSAEPADAVRRGPVIRTLNDITAIEQKTVLEQVKTVFAQQQWTVQGSVYQASGDIHIYNEPSTPRTPEKAKPLVERWQAYASLAATILTIIISVFVIKEKVQDPPIPSTVLAPALEGKSRLAPDQPSDGIVLDDQNRRLSRVEIGSLRQELMGRAGKGQRVTVLLVTTNDGSDVESRESRIRDRYAIEAALGAACYTSDTEEPLAFVEWRLPGAVHALPFEWYHLRELHACGNERVLAPSIVVIRLPEEALSPRLLSALASLSRSLICQELPQKHECLLQDDRRKLVRLNPAIQQAVTFKIIGPHSSSAFRALLEETGDQSADFHEGVIGWPNAGGAIELYSPWSSAMKGLLAYGLKKEAGKGEACATYGTCELEFHRRLAGANIRLVYDVGSDDLLFGTLVEELERRQVRLGWDPVILIGEWDSFYGRALPIEFRAAACAKVATFSDAELKQILVPTTIKSWCPTVARAIDLQIQRPADYESLTLNVIRYSSGSGLDGEVPGKDKSRAVRADKVPDDHRDRPEGTSQVDYVRALMNRIYEEGEGARAIGIFGTDFYDSLLIIKALRPAFPHAIFFTIDLDARYLHPSEYKWTRNMVIASPFGLQLDGGLQREVPPFRSSYQASAYFATLQAVGHVICRREQQAGAPSGPCTTAYHAALTLEDRLYDAGPHIRLFEVGRNGAIDLSIVEKEGVRTIHPLRPDLAYTYWYGQLKQGVGFDNAAVAAAMAVVFALLVAVTWSNQRLWSGIARYPRALGITAVVLMALFTVFVLVGGADALLANHDEGEPFSWTAGVSIWPSELLVFLGVVLSALLFVKGARDLIKNGEHISEKFRFENTERPQRFSPSAFWTNLQRVYHPIATVASMRVDQAWVRYREASRLSQGIARTLLLFILYLGAMWAIEYFVLDEEYIHPCRGRLSCQVDSFLTRASFGLVVWLNLTVFDAVMLCRRWIGWVTASTGGWSEPVQEWYIHEYGMGGAPKAEFEKLKYLAVVDLIAQRTEVVNRLIRYPFITLVIMIAARNEYFDVWNYPVLFLLSWSLNGLLALFGAFLLYQSARRAKDAMLAGLSREMVQVLGIGKDHDVRVKQIQHVINEVEANKHGAFASLYQQPVVEASLYGVIALMQYWYMQ